MVKLEIELPEGFLDEEIRCGYTVTAKAKRAWAVQMDLLHKLDEVCKKYNLRYFADSGTLLGAARDKGYIPWDDDIDIVMLREDYEKLRDVAPGYVLSVRGPEDDVVTIDSAALRLEVTDAPDAEKCLRRQKAAGSLRPTRFSMRLMTVL